MAEPDSSPANTATDSLAGRRLGDYQFLRRLGQGAMAEVYLAEQVSLGRRVAVKVLKVHLAADASYVTRFQNEARAAAALVHANIVQIYEVGCLDGVHFIAQEYVPGVNLHELLARRGPPDVRLALVVMSQVAAALAKAASQGVVHRDVKPENIMIAATGEVKVADFGLARVFDPAHAVNLTQVGVTMGTPLYMSPEQVEGRPLDPRSDLYSLGVTSYHMLAGEPPFTGDTPLAVAVQHLHKEARPLASLRSDLPIALAQIVHRLMAKEPAARYVSARELLVDLRAVPGFPLGADELGFSTLDLPPAGEATAGRLQATQQLSAVMRAAHSTSRQQRRRAVAIWGAAALVALLLGAGVAYWRREPFLLAGVEQLPSGIERQPTAREQYLFAGLAGTIEAWQSVEQFYPGDEYYVRRARQQIARIYLQQDDYDRALMLFGEFVVLDDEPELKAFGLAGQFLVFSLREEPDRALGALATLFPIRDKLQDDMLRQSLARAIRANQAALGQQTAEQWEGWVTARFGEEES